MERRRILYADYKYYRSYLTFEILTGGTIGFQCNGSSDASDFRTIQYSKNGGGWTNLTSSAVEGGTTINVSAGDVIRWKGNSSYGIDGSRWNFFTASSSCTFNIYGNIMSLRYSDNFIGNDTLQEDYIFERLFRLCTGVRSAENLVLPAKVLTSNCYNRMFSTTPLTVAPKLPATTLAPSCYSGMFYGCTSLTTAPELPATTLADYCYSYMLVNCTSLTTAPELPATTMADYCYWSIFEGCTNLTTVPSDLLPATTMAYSCYRGIFYQCTALTTAPELPATTLADNCYYDMFGGCTSLTKAPELPATTLADCCYWSMFKGCTSLTTAPSELPATTLTFCCYLDMFNGCTSLTIAPRLLATTLAYSCCQGMFIDCTSLTEAPELLATTLAERCYIWMFQKCSNLRYIKCLATNMSATFCLYNWVENVSSRGTFVKSSQASWSTGISGIPSGWTVRNA